MTWVKPALTGLVVVGLVAGLGYHFFKNRIAMFVFEQAVKQNAGIDRSAKLPDGLHVYLCGTGSPIPDVSRAGPCIGVLAGNRAYVFDMGSGGMRKLGAMGFPIDRLESVYLTHLHSDHIDGLGELLLLAWVGGGRDAPLPVMGPTGTAEVVGGFNAAYRIDSTFRIAHHGIDVVNPAGFGGVASEIIIPYDLRGRKVVLDDGDLKITAIGVAHAPVEPAFGYRIDYKDRSVAISGDTTYHPGFVAASEGVDLMLHEALDPEMVSVIQMQVEERGQANTARILADIPDYHASPEDAARAANHAKAAHLVLYHLVPPLPLDLLGSVFLGSSRSEFRGPVTIGKDGMIFTLPSGSDRIIRTQGY